MRRRRHPRPSRTPDPGSLAAEWVGGRLTPPFFVMDRAEPYRPPLVVWMDLPAGLIVGQQIVAPEDAAGALGRALRVAMESPMVGPPRRPARIRVADRALADEVRAVVGDDVPVVVAPTPELDDLLESLIEMSSGGADARASYLEGGRIAPESVRRLFVAAELLWTAAPWKVAYDSQVLRMDIPALGVDGACVSIIGNLGEAFGVLIFPSLDAFERFADAGEQIGRRDRRVDFRTSWIALDFERGGDIPPSMRREIATHGWPVAVPDAHPVVTHHDRDGALRPLSQRDVDVARACAFSLTAFFEKHRDLFGRDDEDFEPVCESWFDADDLEVRFTVPYEAFELFDLDEPPAEPAPAVRAKVGRNDPCPCGSGRKYKKCHLAADEKERSDAAPPEGIEGRLARTLARFAATRFGTDWNRSIDDFTDPTAPPELAVPWSLYGAAVEGRRIVDWYLDEHGSRIPVQERSWLEAHRAAWLSVWEVTAVERGVGMTLRDLLSDEVRVVVERSASQTLVERDAILARVVGREDAAVLCGVHPRALPPVDAAEVVRLARGRLRRKTAIPPERLRDAELGRYLIRQWEWAVEDLDVRSQLPPDLRNTDGNPLLLTIDHFAVADDAREAVEAALAGLDGIQPPEPGDDPPAYSFVRDGDPGNPLLETVLVGRAWLTATGLRVETNSIERADALRARIEVACGDRIRHRIREHADPMSSKVPRGAPPPPPPPEVQEALLEMQRRYYASWLDESIPALGGQTPREAARTASGRRMLDTLLKDMENRERRGEGDFDFSGIRRELRLE